MKYIFTRTYVGQDNKSFYRGSEVPADFPKDVLERFVADGLITGIESPNEFVAKVNKSAAAKKSGAVDPIEDLDPDNKPRSK